MAVLLEGAAAASILIVDDTIEDLRLLSKMLERGQHYEIRPVSSGAVALQEAHQRPPDLILMDVNMPEMSGYATCTRLRESPGLRHVPVIFLTAMADTASKVRGFQAGGVDYITKPYQLEEVLARVGLHVSLANARAKLAQSLERLKEVEKLRDDLVHMIVHDMRSPLQVLTGHLDFFHEQVRSGQAVDPNGIEAAARSARSLKRMANDLLDVRRLEDGRLRLDLVRCDLAQVVTVLGKNLSALVRSRPLELDCAHPVPARCDVGLVQRVVENLLSNAFKHTPSHRPVVISVKGIHSGVRVEVHDAGPGIPVEARERIFEKFGALAVRNDGSHHSAGLGLAFCKLAVTAHGGRIGVTCPDSGGSIFWFELPA